MWPVCQAQILKEKMKKKKTWMLPVILTLCGTMAVTTACRDAKVQQSTPATEQAPESPQDTVTQVVSDELLRTSQSWDGVELPDYLQGRPELVAVKYVFPAGKKLGWHHHPVMNYGILVQGELTIIGQDGKEKVVHEGEAVVEMVNTIHHGENRGTKPVILYMFYLSQKDLPLAVQHPEIPLE
jgi:quercetin dioxygenase-like cupin family protein